MRGLAGLERERESLAGKVILVTGGSQGIGLACAAEAVAAGARVAIAARSPDTLREAEARLAEIRRDALRFRGGRRVASAVDALVAEVVEWAGRIDGLVHAAAVIGPIGPALDLDPAEWLDAVRIDLWGTFLVARAVGRAMRAQGGGRMVLLSGGGATSPFPNFSAYAASKAGVVRLAETLAAELAEHGIEVNALAPGFVATRIHDAVLAASGGGRRVPGATRRSWKRAACRPSCGGRRSSALGPCGGFDGPAGRRAVDEWWTWPERREAIRDPTSSRCGGSSRPTGVGRLVNRMHTGPCGAGATWRARRQWGTRIVERGAGVRGGVSENRSASR